LYLDGFWLGSYYFLLGFDELSLRENINDNGGTMKITIRRGTSTMSYGFGVKWKVYADDVFMGIVRDTGTISFDKTRVSVIRITGFFLRDVLIPLEGINEDVEIRCFYTTSMWTARIYAYVIARDKYLGEYGY
jgi:hypothetical protein